MPVDYRDAAERHWEDARYLESVSRLMTADHLYGISSECALKAIMAGLGMPLKENAAPALAEHRVHNPDIWNQFVAFVNTRGGIRYSAMLQRFGNPFGGWSIHQRYNHRNDVTADEIADHKMGARESIKVMTHARTDGVVA